jgi:hypothetical protein
MAGQCSFFETEKPDAVFIVDEGFHDALNTAYMKKVGSLPQNF